MKIKVTTLYVDDQEKALRFYTDILGFVKKNEVSVKEHVAGVAKQLGDEITIRRFFRFQVGEGPVA